MSNLWPHRMDLKLESRCLQVKEALQCYKTSSLEHPGGGVDAALDQQQDRLSPRNLSLLLPETYTQCMPLQPSFRGDTYPQFKPLHPHPAPAGVKMVAWERGQYYLGGKLRGFELPKRVFPCETPAQVRAKLPPNVDVVVFQCRNPVHRAHYELFSRSLDAANVRPGAVCLVHPTCGPTQVIGLE